MIQFCSRQEAIRRMNQWGGESSPFLFLIDYAQETCLVERLEEIDPQEIKFNLNGSTNQPEGLTQPLRRPFSWHVHPLQESQYRQSFQQVVDAIHAGNSYLVNLTAPTPVETDLTLLEIFQRSEARYKLWVKNHFVVFSPEIFVRICEGQISSYPMKGTIDARIPQAEQIILHDEKEAAEHATIVDLIRNDLSQIATHVHVARYRYIDRLETHHGPLLQVSSEVTGTLPATWQKCVGDLLFALLPAGSITGAPKPKTLEIIAKAEGYEREFYTGVMGIYDGKQLDSAVMIRFMEQQGERMLFKSGGGITAKSDCHKEYEELIQKIYVPIY